VLFHLVRGKPILLVIDHYTCHTSAEFRRFLKSKNIDLLLVPPACTFGLQPLDLGVNRSMKANYRKISNNRYVLINDPSLTDDERKLERTMPHSHLFRIIAEVCKHVEMKMVFNSFRCMYQNFKQFYDDGVNDPSGLTK
jgi:hypothetical protein